MTLENKLTTNDMLTFMNAAIYKPAEATTSEYRDGYITKMVIDGKCTGREDFFKQYDALQEAHVKQNGLNAVNTTRYKPVICNEY